MYFLLRVCGQSPEGAAWVAMRETLEALSSLGEPAGTREEPGVGVGILKPVGLIASLQ